MPRDIPVGNGNLLIAFDSDYQIRDVYFPYVGQENHAGWGPCRFGVFADGRIAWTSDQGWEKSLGYLKDTLATDVTLVHDGLKVRLRCNDCVDFNRNVFIKKIEATNLSDKRRELRLFLQQDLSMYGTKVGDTAYYDPRLSAMVHYRGARYMMASFCAASFRGATARPPWTGTAWTRSPQARAGSAGRREPGATPRMASSPGNPISQGAVDSTIGLSVTLEPGASETVYYYLAAGLSYDELRQVHGIIKARSPAAMLERTIGYWRAWVSSPAYNFGNLPPSVQDLFKRSLLVIRTQIDNRGAVIAANDSDVMQFSRDTYSYMWPRDGALVCHALDLAGFPDVTRRFYTMCRDLLTEEGYFLHKYNPDGTPASSWHPWVVDGKQRLPIQEDETALVLWALWRHFWMYRDVEYVRPLYHSLICKAADFMVSFRDPETHLPLPSYDLWEERYGVHTYTTATVYGGLLAARNFAQTFGDQRTGRAIRPGRRRGPRGHGQAPLEREPQAVHPPPRPDRQRAGRWTPRSTPACSPSSSSTPSRPPTRASRAPWTPSPRASGSTRPSAAGTLRERHLPPRVERPACRPRQPVVRLHHLAGGLLDFARLDSRATERSRADLRVGRHPRPALRRPGRAGRPVHQPRPFGEPAHVEPRDVRPDADEIPPETRGPAPLPDVRPERLPHGPPRAAPDPQPLLAPGSRGLGGRRADARPRDGRRRSATNGRRVTLSDQHARLRRVRRVPGPVPAEDLRDVQRQSPISTCSRLAACVLCRECETYCPIGIVHLTVEPGENKESSKSKA